MANNHSASTEAKITLGLLKAVGEDKGLTQRSAAGQLGIALGLVNTYLKRCVKKGFVKISQVPSNRYAYYLTPQGFAEKSRLTAEYLSQSLILFRQSQSQYSEIISQCTDNGWTRIAFYGSGDLSEIAAVCAQEYSVKIVAVVQSDGAKNVDTDEVKSRLPIVQTVQEAGQIDVVILTDITNPQNSFDVLSKVFPKDRIMTPQLLEIARTPPILKE